MLAVFRKNPAIVALAIMAFSATAAYGGISLSSNINLSNDGTDSKSPAIFSLDTNVYVAWYDADTNEVLFTNSTDSGATFDPYESIGVINTGGSAATFADPKVASDGTNAFIAWHDGPDIRYKRSIDNGRTWPGGLGDDIGNSAASKNAFLQLVNSTNDRIYAIWIDDDGANPDKIKFSASSNSGASFDVQSDFEIGTSAGDQYVDIAAQGDNVYIIWVDDADIRVSASTDGGATFAVSQLDIGDDGTGTVRPSIAANGNNVYAAWKEGSSIVFKKSTNNGMSFEFPTSPNDGVLGTTVSSATTGPEVVVDSDDNVYVFWSDNSNIKMRKSDGGGANFEAEVNVSNTAESSLTPSVSASENNIFVVWRENTATSTDKNILFKSNDDDFASTNELTEDGNTQFANIPQIHASGNNAFVVWQEKTGGSGTDGEVQFKKTSRVLASIAFDQSQYKTSETATITVTDSDSDTDSSPQTITATVTSTTDGSGILLELTETGGSTGVFANTLTFSTDGGLGVGVGSNILAASPGDTITATFDTASASSTIYPRSISFDSTDYILSDTPHITVNDNNSNEDILEIEEITVTVSSTNTGDSTTITLSETGVDTGIFGTTADNEIVLMNGDFRVPLDRTITITETVNGANPDSAQIDQKIASANSDTDAAPKSITLTETGIDTNIYSGTLGIVSSSPAANEVLASVCDKVTITSSGGLKTNVFVTTCDEPTTKPLQVSVSSASSDIIVATFEESSDSEIVKFAGGESGGGGGGLVRPTVVLNAIAILGGGSNDQSPPLSTLNDILKTKHIKVPDHIKSIVESHDPKTPLNPITDQEFDLPLSINENGYPLGSDENTILTEKITTGMPTSFKMTFYEQTDLEHISIYLNVRDGMRDHQSDTFVLFNKDKPLEIVDKNGFFEDVSFEMQEEDEKKIAVFVITFAKEMEKSDMIYKAWDFKRRGTAVTVHDAIEIMPNQESDRMQEPQEQIEDKTQKVNEEKVPQWIKSNAKWWAEGQINDETFTSGIGFLISENIINVPTEPNVSKSKDDDEQVTEEEETAIEIPEWIKTNARWWSEDLIDENTFISGIEYLVKNKIITVS